jgi:hypothetical protein
MVIAERQNPDPFDPRPASREVFPMAARRLLSRRILVVVNETMASEALHDVVDTYAAGRAVVAVVAPALIGRVRYWTSDDREARAAAEERLDWCLDSLRESGVDALGFVGDADPLQAIDDALRLFDADAIIIAAHPNGSSNWLAQDLVGRARRRFSRPVHHIADKLERPLAVASAA